MIRITREAYFDVVVAYKIFIDGVYRGKIKRGETKEFAVENGRHIVRAEMYDRRSNELHVSVNNSIVDIEAGSNVKGWRDSQDFEYALYEKNDYLFLRKKKTMGADIEEAENPIEDSEEEKLNHADSEAKNVKTALEKIQKLTRNLVLVLLTLAGINVFFGIVLLFSPALFDRLLFWVLVLSPVPFVFGFAYLALSIGVYRRSRAVAIIAMIVLFIDLVLFNIAGLGNTDTITRVLRTTFVAMLCGGLTVSFKYHALKKKYEATTNNEISVLIQESKPRVEKAQIIVCAIIGIVGIGALIYWSIAV